MSNLANELPPNPRLVEGWFLESLVDHGAPVHTIEPSTLPFRVGCRNGLLRCLPSASVSKEHAEICLERD
jgi:hypothetical protein